MLPTNFIELCKEGCWRELPSIDGNRNTCNDANLQIPACTELRKLVYASGMLMKTCVSEKKRKEKERLTKYLHEDGKWQNQLQ